MDARKQELESKLVEFETRVGHLEGGLKESMAALAARVRSMLQGPNVFDAWAVLEAAECLRNLPSDTTEKAFEERLNTELSVKGISYIA